ncbi:MAG TPA: hypothetical protein VMV05_11880 [bacterium]|nr:hypothetical protein [bacterium]
MRRFMQILTILLVVGLVWALFTGLGLGKAFKRSKMMVKTHVINDFEYPNFPNDDYGWTTGEYAKIEPSTENQSHGKRCAKVSFYATRQFYPTPVPGVDPMNSSHIFYTQAGQGNWRPEIILDTESVTKLTTYVWEDYTDFKFDAYNPYDSPVTYHLQVADSHTFVYESSGPLTPKKVTNIDIPLEDMAAVRLDLANIRSIKISADMNGAPDPLILFIDYLRLEGDSNTKKKFSLKGTPTPQAAPVPAAPTTKVTPAAGQTKI